MNNNEHVNHNTNNSKMNVNMVKCNSNNSRSSINSSKMIRLTNANGDDKLRSVKLDPNAAKKIESVIPKHKQDLLKWSGWGYKDSKFLLENDEVIFTGSRYPIGGGIKLPLFKPWVQKKFAVDLSIKVVEPELPTTYPEIVPSPEFHEELRKHKIDHSDEGLDRLIRCHGQTLHDIHTLRTGKFKRIPDLVIWPTSHDDVVNVIRLANKHNVVIIPFGGGTSVSGAATCPQKERRPIAVLDTSQMNKMLWLDRENLVACFESGIIGQDLERELKEMNLTMGHEPDSYEFSTLGGWVATRASGMKKNIYGNIEDIVVRVKMVTSKGVLEKHVSAPRISCGPDFNHIILGSEGTLGVITEVLVKVRPLPEVKKYGSLVFPNFECGVHCLREVARHRLQPASIRLIDNEQFEFGQALKLESSWAGNLLDGIKKQVLTKIKGFDLSKMVVATLVFEGNKDAVKKHEEQINAIAKKHQGFSAGSTNGEKGYVLTFVIAYIRDLALEFQIVAESFETSMPWDRCETLCRNVKECVRRECANANIKHFLISCRVTQSYDAGACVYFYFGFNYVGFSSPVKIYEEIENRARDEVLASGGSISHHHGVGKVRKQWYPQTISAVGIGLFNATKKELDPNNIFATGNLVGDNDAHDENDEDDEIMSIKSKL